MSRDAGDMGSICWLGRSPGEENGNQLQYSCLGNPMARGASGSAGHGVSKESDMTYIQNLHTHINLKIKLKCICLSKTLQTSAMTNV